MAKKIWVKAKSRGQRANGAWVDENSPPFQIEEPAFSERWMKKLTAAEAEKLTAKDDPAGPLDEELDLTADVERLTKELADMTSERDAAAKSVDDLTAERDKLKADLGKSQGEVTSLKEKLVDAEAAAKAKDNAPPAGTGEKPKA